MRGVAHLWQPDRPEPIERAKVRQIWRYIDGAVAERMIALIYERVHRRASGGTDSPLSSASQPKAIFKGGGLIDQSMDRWADRLWRFIARGSFPCWIIWSCPKFGPIMADYYRRLKSRQPCAPCWKIGGSHTPFCFESGFLIKAIYNLWD